MNEEELTPHIEELKRVLKDREIDNEAAINTFKNMVTTFKMDVSTAKAETIRMYGGGSKAFITADAVAKKIGELNGTEANVDITAKVVFSEKREITARGEKKQIISGILGDETGTASFTIWDANMCEPEKGAVYLFKNAYIKTWNDKIQINMGNRGTVEKKDGVEIALPERTVTYSETESKVMDLREGLNNVTVTGRLLTVEKRDITVKGEPRTVFSGLLADDSGKIQYSAWSDFGLVEGECVRIKGAYTRGWRGIPQLNFGERSEVTKVDDTYGDADLGGSNVKTIGQLAETGGGLDVTVSGTIVDLRQGSGLIARCPECRKSILNGECAAHGTVQPIDDLRMKIVVDDGEGAISVIVNREFTEKLTGITLSAAKDLARARGNADLVAKGMAEKVIMKRVTVRGNAMMSEFGLDMIAKDISEDTIDVNAEAAKLLEEVEGSL